MTSRMPPAAAIDGAPSGCGAPLSGLQPEVDAPRPPAHRALGRKARKRLARTANFIFVGGSGHCGSSLLTAMLGAHPRIYAIPVETNLFGRDVPDDRKRRRLAQFARQCDKPGIDYVCEKTPRHIRAFDEILRLYPEAKLIAIVRDPRDVVASYKRRGARPGLAIRKWKVACRWLADWQSAGLPVHVVRFEGLVADPPAVLADVCGFLGLSYEPAMLDYWKDPRLWYKAADSEKPDTVQGNEAHRAHRNWQLHQPVMRDRIGTWQGELTTAELDAIGEALSGLAPAHGYDLPRPRPKWLRWPT